MFTVGDGGSEGAIGDLLNVRAQPQGPTLAFVTYEHALALVEACNRVGIAIPHDLSICAITDHERSERPSP